MRALLHDSADIDENIKDRDFCCHMYTRRRRIQEVTLYTSIVKHEYLYKFYQTTGNGVKNLYN